MIRTLTIALFAAAAGCASAGEAPPPPPAEDACGASQHQNLVGRPRAEIPAPPTGAVWRVHSTEDAVTMDYSPRRLNVVWDAKTGRVVSVACG